MIISYLVQMKPVLLLPTNYKTFFWSNKTGLSFYIMLCHIEINRLKYTQKITLKSFYCEELVRECLSFCSTQANWYFFVIKKINFKKSTIYVTLEIFYIQCMIKKKWTNNFFKNNKNIWHCSNFMKIKLLTGYNLCHSGLVIDWCHFGLLIDCCHFGLVTGYLQI